MGLSMRLMNNVTARADVCRLTSLLNCSGNGTILRRHLPGHPARILRKRSSTAEQIRGRSLPGDGPQVYDYRLRVRLPSLPVAHAAETATLPKRECEEFSRSRFGPNEMGYRNYNGPKVATFDAAGISQADAPSAPVGAILVRLSDSIRGLCRNGATCVKTGTSPLAKYYARLPRARSRMLGYPSSITLPEPQSKDGADTNKRIWGA